MRSMITASGSDRLSSESAWPASGASVTTHPRCSRRSFASRAESSLSSTTRIFFPSSEPPSLPLPPSLRGGGREGTEAALRELAGEVLEELLVALADDDDGPVRRHGARSVRRRRRARRLRGAEREAERERAPRARRALERYGGADHAREPLNDRE